MFLQLEWGIELVHVDKSISARARARSYFINYGKPTCARGTNGGPPAISKALVPGLTLRVEFTSSLSSWVYPGSCSVSLPNESPTEGDWGPIWTSVSGGGLGNRGELEG